MSSPSKRVDAGFSFIELLAYMAIAALLVLAAVPQFNAYRAKAIDHNTRSDVRNIAAAYEGWAIEHPDETFPFVTKDWAGTGNLDFLATVGVTLSSGTRIWVRDRHDQLRDVPAGVEYCIWATNDRGAKWNSVDLRRLTYTRERGMGAECGVNGA